jgi:hypothetical protein
MGLDCNAQVWSRRRGDLRAVLRESPLADVLTSRAAQP